LSIDRRNLTPSNDAVKSLSVEDRQIYEEMMQKAKCNGAFDDIEPGPDCMSGSQLPSHSDVNKSCLTNQRIVVSRASASCHYLCVFKGRHVSVVTCAPKVFLVVHVRLSLFVCVCVSVCANSEKLLTRN